MNVSVLLMVYMYYSGIKLKKELVCHSQEDNYNCDSTTLFNSLSQRAEVLSVWANITFRKVIITYCMPQSPDLQYT